MKKIFTILLICVLLVGGTYILTQKVDVITMFEIPATYLDEGFVLNDLQIKDSTYFYNNLTNEQKQVYTEVAKAVKNLEKKADISNYKGKEEDFNSDVSVVMEAFLADHPEVFYINPKYEISNISFLFFKARYLNISYNVEDKNELEEKTSQMKEKIDEIIQQAKGKTDFENEKIIHDILGKKVSYDHLEQVPDISHTAYGALVLDTAVCDGMAKALQILLDKVNITSYFVTGTTDNGPHAWNIVKLDDKFYHLDLTSNKSVNDDKYKNIVIHSYFNITDDKILKTHVISDKYKVPKCTDDEYEYYNKNDFVISSTESFDYELKRILNVQKSDEIFEFKTLNVNNVENKMAQTFARFKINSLNKNSKIYYYNVLDSYIIINK